MCLWIRKVSSIGQISCFWPSGQCWWPPMEPFCLGRDGWIVETPSDLDEAGCLLALITSRQGNVSGNVTEITLFTTIIATPLDWRHMLGCPQGCDCAYSPPDKLPPQTNYTFGVQGISPLPPHNGQSGDREHIKEDSRFCALYLWFPDLFTHMTEYFPSRYICSPMYDSYSTI